MSHHLKRLLRLIGAASVLFVATVGITGSAAAAIDCEEGFQRVQGSLIATPYCQDENLANVARTYGMSVSAAAIRHNPNYKRYVCQLVGRDNRVHTTCIDAGAASPRGRN